MFYEPNKHTIHAEDSCIRNCKNKKNIQKAIMILVRIHPNSEDYLDCHCCDMCKKKIQKAKVSKVYYVSANFQ
mgnify:CR=1 FL=1|uniref:CMP/dCMP-type deaminase domain-containing protein n=1 Tax=viral metagenome TaxID=1070528 RepID=A0A6C0ACF8_9ZZZZ